jgi:hypothetical protein
MEISGRIIAVLPIRSGTSKNGNEWKSQDYVLETDEQYPKRMCFNVFGDKIDQFAIQEKENLNVSFDIDCHEYQGRWFNNIRAWKVDRIVDGAPMPSGGGAPIQQTPPPEFNAGDKADDLPF